MINVKRFYDIIDVPLTNREGRFSYYAYKSFISKKKAENYRMKNCPLWRSKVIEVDTIIKR